MHRAKATGWNKMLLAGTRMWPQVTELNWESVAPGKGRLGGRGVGTYVALGPLLPLHNFPRSLVDKHTNRSTWKRILLHSIGEVIINITIIIIIMGKPQASIAMSHT